MAGLLVIFEHICRAYPTRTKWVFVPSHAVGRTLGDRVALAGTDWANLRFVTPFEIALRMGAPFLVERGVDPSEEGLGPALMMRLLLALPQDAGYFRPLADQPQLAAALWSTLRELRMTGLGAADLPADAFASSEKHAELCALVASYERYLVDNRRGDRATVFTEALQHLDWCPIQPQDYWTVLPDVPWSPLEQRLFQVLPVASSADSAAVGPPPTDSTASFFHAGGTEAEIEEVFRRILASGRSLDQVEIVCANPRTAALVWEKAVRFQWPVTVAHGLPVAVTRPGRALLSFGEWVDDDFAAGRLRRLLQSGDVRLDRLDISPARAARLLVKAQAAWGRATFRLSLHRYGTSARRRAGRDDLPDDQRAGLVARANEAEALARWIDALVATVPQADASGTVCLADVAASARAFVDACAARTSALDRVAAAALVEALAELRALGDYRCTLDHALRFIAQRVDGLTVGADRPRPGHLHVSALTSAGYAGRPMVFAMGLEEGRVFPVPFEDPVLLDTERARISPLLRLSHQRTDEAVALGRARLAAIAAQPGVAVAYSYSCRDLREYRQTYASWLMLEAFRQARGNPAATYQDLHKHLGEPVSCVPDAPADALDASRWWIHAIVQAGPAAAPAVLAAYPPLSAGIAAEAARAAAAFTPYDGHVPAAGRALDPCRDGAVVSPTQLEDAARCPFRYFLRRGLGVEAIESGDRDRDVWLDPLLRGTLLHDLYAALLRRCRAEARRPSIEIDAAWFAGRGADVLANLAVEMPPPSVEVRERETMLFLRDLAIFLDAEAALDPARTPVGLEVGFGRGGAEAVEPLSRDEPVLLDLGGGLNVRVAGRIDRIDQVGPAAFEIVDYKTGRYWPDDWKGTFAGGTRLQHALYGLAAAELLRVSSAAATVTGARSYFPSEKGQQERKHLAAASRARVGEVLAGLRQVIVDGLFVHAADEEACTWCDYGHACGQAAAARAAAKRADATLAPVTRLAAHE